MIYQIGQRGAFSLKWDEELPGASMATDEPAVAVEMQESAVESEETQSFLRALRQSKRELEIARKQFETVVDPMLIDHVVFRLGAAERHFNYLFQLARRYQVKVDGMRWEWYEED